MKEIIAESSRGPPTITDYERVMLRTENWNEVFKAVFVRAESLRESLVRLYPVHVCTMHARSES